MSSTIIIFGASGDLTSRKLVPALYQLFRKGRLNEPLRLVGFSRSDYSHEAWRSKLFETTQEFLGENFDKEHWEDFSKQIYYHPGDINKAEDFRSVGKFLSQIEGNKSSNSLYYL